MTVWPIPYLNSHLQDMVERAIAVMTWIPDRRTMLVNIQRPGELGSHPSRPKNPDGSRWSHNQIARNPTAFSQWPSQGSRPRSATAVICRVDGGAIDD